MDDARMATMTNRSNHGCLIAHRHARRRQLPSRGGSFSARDARPVPVPGRMEPSIGEAGRPSTGEVGLVEMGEASRVATGEEAMLLGVEALAGEESCDELVELPEPPPPLSS